MRRDSLTLPCYLTPSVLLTPHVLEAFLDRGLGCSLAVAPRLFALSYRSTKLPRNGQAEQKFPSAPRPVHHRESDCLDRLGQMLEPSEGFARREYPRRHRLRP